MKFNVISLNTTDKSGMHLSESAWKYSRALDDDAALEDILKLDLPVNEMPSAVIQFECTVIEREVITTMRNHTIWARSSRVDNVLNFTVQDDFYNIDKNHYEYLRTRMIAASKIDRQDDYRNNLPLVSNCKFTARINMRQAVRFLNTFIKLSELSKNASILFTSAIEEFIKLVSIQFGININHAIKSKKQFLIHDIMKSDDGMVGEFLTISARIPFYLRAQLVRHRELMISDDLINIIKDNTFTLLTFNTMMRIQVSGHVEDWFNIVSKRNCWLAQYDLWSELLNKVERFCNFGKSALPCSDGECPYVKDVQLRKDGKDPGSPCPIEIGFDNGKVSLNHRDKMLRQYAQEQRPAFWMDQICELEVI